MPLPVFPASPAAPQRGIDSDEVFRTKADAFAAWWALLPDALQTWLLGVIDAIGDANYTAASENELTIGTGALALSIESGKKFIAGQFVTVVDAIDPLTNWMFGRVQDYDIATGALTFTSLRVGGAGTKSAWMVALSGPQGEGGDVLPDFAGNAEKVLSLNDAATAAEWRYREQYIAQAADRALTNSTATQRLFDASATGALTLSPGRYEFRAMLYVTGMESVNPNNAAFALKGAGTATLAQVLQQSVGIDNDNVTAAAPATLNAANSATITEVAYGVVSGSLLVSITGGFTVTVAGTIVPSIALLQASAATLRAGSYFTCRRLGAGATLGNWS